MGFSKMYNFSFFGKFYCITGFCDKNSIFANLQIFLQILNVNHKSFLMMYHLSYLDIKHGITKGGQIDPSPPQLILVFKYPSRDRVKQCLKVGTCHKNVLVYTAYMLESSTVHLTQLSFHLYKYLIQYRRLICVSVIHLDFDFLRKLSRVSTSRFVLIKYFKHNFHIKHSNLFNQNFGR